MDGTAHRPFVYRALLPATVRGTLAVLPESVEARLEVLAREIAREKSVSGKAKRKEGKAVEAGAA